jgi:Protein of unknown function (DUF3558)
MSNRLVKVAACLTAALLFAASEGCSPSEPIPGRGVPNRAMPAATTTTTTVTPSTKRRLPPRPRDVDVTGLDPCEGLTPQQAKSLGFDRSPMRDTDFSTGNDTCAFVGRRDGFGVLVLFVPNEDAQAWLYSDHSTGVRPKVVSVAGYPALRITRTKQSQKYRGPDCVIVVDVHDGQYLYVHTEVAAGPARTEDSLCKSGYEIAGMVVTNAAQGVVGRLQDTSYSTTATLPPRPREVDLAGVDPCGLLTRAQLVQLQYDGPGAPEPLTDPVTNSPACAFPSKKEKVQSTISVVRGEDASAWLGSRPRRPTVPPKVIDIAGFPALQTVGHRNTEEVEKCAVMVSFHSGQYVMVFSFPPGPWTDTEDAYCAEARTVATDVVQTLIG